jgi:D-inositol-3-phosphate glycosyltransferase
LVALARTLSIADVVRFIPPQLQSVLAEWYRAASVVVVPSYKESFGLVAIEAQACGTPVVAARVGGLATAVADGESGILLDTHDPAEYASAIDKIVSSPTLLSAMRESAVLHAHKFGWARTAEQTLMAYDVAYDAASRVARPPVMAPLVL